MLSSHADVEDAGLDQVGPIDYLVVEFTSGHVPGDAFHHLLHLVEQDAVRVLDLEFVTRNASGAVSLADPDQVVTTAGHELGTFAGVSSGLLDGDDITRIGELIEPDSLAAIVVYENVWVAAMAGQLSRDHARIVSIGQIPLTDLDAVLDQSET